MKGTTSMSDTTTLANPFNTAEMVAKRTEAMTTIAPELVSAWTGFKNSTEALANIAARAISEVRNTYGVLINGTYYPDVFATQQDTKKGVSEWLKSNGLPTGDEEGASTLRYHFTSAAKRIHAVSPSTFGPEGYAFGSGKWSPIVTLTADEAAQKAEDDAVKTLQKRATKQLVGALVKQAEVAPAMVITEMAGAFRGIDLSKLTLGDRQALGVALATLANEVEAKLDFLGLSPALSEVA